MLETTESLDTLLTTPQTCQQSGSILFVIGSISQAKSRISHSHDHTPLKWRSLSDVLAQWNVCIMEPENYEEATQDDSWKKVMQYDI